VAEVKSIKHSKETCATKEDKQSLWFNRLLRHPARKWSLSTLSTQSPQGARVPEPHGASTHGKNYYYPPPYIYRSLLPSEMHFGQ